MKSAPERRGARLAARMRQCAALAAQIRQNRTARAHLLDSILRHYLAAETHT